MATGDPRRHKPAPFIADQGMRLLRQVREPKKYLSTAAFAAKRKDGDGRDGPGKAAAGQDDPWSEVGREQVADDAVPDQPLNRLVLVSDAGMGKSTTMLWLRWWYSAAASNKVAFLIEASELSQVADDPGRFVRVLIKKLRQVPGLGRESLPEQTARQILERLRAAGRLVLLIDGIDQAKSRAVAGLAEALRDENWRSCRIVLASRPYALEYHWKELFGSHDQAPGWRFVQLDEFNEEQQERYLGQRRWASVPIDGRQILTVPRVLYYLRMLSPRQLKRIRTLSDVYIYATRRLYDEALRAGHAQGLDGDQAEEFLAAIAYWMVRHGANFDRVAGSPLLALKKWLTRRFFRSDTPTHRKECVALLKQVAAMNQFLHHGLLEAGCPQHIEWRNRSLQEFYAGLYLAKYARPADVAPLNDWLPQADSEEADQYYWVWRFAAEMPPGGRRPLPWIRALATVYQPGGSMPPGTRRATEIIYRSWTTMERLAGRNGAEPGSPSSMAGLPNRPATKLANNALSGFQAEFPLLLDQGKEWANWLRQGFRPIPPGAFEMGSPEEEPDRYWDETQHLVRITRAFQLHRYPVTNAAYELFDPGHQARRDEYSRDDNQPVIYVTWYDAWCFAQWVSIEGKSCHLPTEAQWEYACRARTNTPFHFGAISDGHQSNVDGKEPYGMEQPGQYLRRTSAVGSYSPNGFGLYDMHGNVWEWCADWYGAYPTGPVDDSAGPSSGENRVLRGGSWLDYAWNSRSANRFRNSPVWRSYLNGFRLARTP